MNRLKRQEIWTWRPVPTVKCALVIYIAIAVVFLALGIPILVETAKLKEVSLRYDRCKTKICTETLVLTDDLTAPIYVYYGLTNFYQNHRLYFRSRDQTQLNGDIRTPSDITTTCDPIITMADLGMWPIYPAANKTLKSTDPVNPCGLIAKSVFNDTYILYSSANTTVNISEINIAWKSDDEKTSRPNNYTNLQWTDVESEHFKVWIRAAATADFRKLWGRITTNLPKGTYTLQIANNYDVSSWEGEKEFVLATTSRFGGKNYLLGGLFVAGGGASIIVALVFAVASRRSRNKTLEEYFPESQNVFKKLEMLLQPEHRSLNPD